MSAVLRPVWVGRMMYAVPPRARVVWPSGQRIAVVLHEGVVTVLTEAGELPVPEHGQRQLRVHYFPDDAGQKVPTKKIR